MLKIALTLSCLAAAPVVVVSSTQDPVPDSKPTSRTATLGSANTPAQGRQDPEQLRAEIERLRAEVEAARASAAEAEAQADEAEAEADRAVAELREALDQLLAEDSAGRERDCAPSRHLISRHQWLTERGHKAHADKALKNLISANRGQVDRINRLAWNLMTEREMAGKHDATALALAQHMAKQSGLKHQYLDTIALAHFLNGSAEQAVAYERRALQHKKNSSEYRRRLRTYESAVATQRATLAAHQRELQQHRDAAIEAAALAQNASSAPSTESTPAMAAAGSHEED